MARLTITLSDARYRALKETAARRADRLAAAGEDCLDRAGIKTVAGAADLMARARQRSRMSEEAAVALAVRETRAARRPRR